MNENLNLCIDYIIRFLLRDEKGQYNKYISYGYKEEALIVIIPSDFFESSVYLTGKSFPSLPLTELRGIPVLFGKGKTLEENGKIIIYADIIASTYFLISRYEECIKINDRDIHGRFLAKNSILYQTNNLNKCLVDEYGELLRCLLREKGVNIESCKKAFSHVYLTHDVDNYRTWNSIYSATRSAIKMVMTKQKNFMLPYKAFINYEKNDPIYTFPWLAEIDNDLKDKLSVECKVIYFIMGAQERTKFDNGYAFNVRTTRKLIHSLKPISDIGYHVSYSAKDDLSRCGGEIKVVEELSGENIKLSRNHYLASKEPEDFEILIENGITDDFTMGFADNVGFRLGTCRPVKWINPITMKLTTLTLHPMTAMDATLDGTHYMNIKEEDEAFLIIRKLLEQVKRHNGEVVLLWHNPSVSLQANSYHRKLYSRVLGLLLQMEEE